MVCTPACRHRTHYGVHTCVLHCAPARSRCFLQVSAWLARTLEDALNHEPTGRSLIAQHSSVATCVILSGGSCHEYYQPLPCDRSSRLPTPRWMCRCFRSSVGQQQHQQQQQQKEEEHPLYKTQESEASYQLSFPCFFYQQINFSQQPLGQHTMSGRLRVYVGNLPDEADKRELEDEFGKFGRLRDVWVARKPPGFAFVEYDDDYDARKAVEEMDGRQVCGNTVRVEIARGGRGGGGRGGYRYDDYYDRRSYDRYDRYERYDRYRDDDPYYSGRGSRSRYDDRDDYRRRRYDDYEDRRRGSPPGVERDFAERRPRRDDSRRDDSRRGRTRSRSRSRSRSPSRTRDYRDRSVSRGRDSHRSRSRSPRQK
eukprot:gene3996-6447_t